MIPATAVRMNHLWSAGITYHGAPVLVARSAASKASWYSSQCARSATSPGENFQFFSGSSSGRGSARCCSSLETCRKNFRTRVPLRAQVPLEGVMSS